MANLPFRGWYYFRMGWSTYFAFIFAAINTLTVTYYLAIKKYPTLTELFPNFIQYVVIISVVGIPILIAIGYVHYKRSKAFRSEVDILFETNPYDIRILSNIEMTLRLSIIVNDILIKLTNKQTISENELNKLHTLQKEFLKLKGDRTFSNKKDMIFLKIGRAHV